MAALMIVATLFTGASLLAAIFHRRLERLAYETGRKSRRRRRRRGLAEIP